MKARVWKDKLLAPVMVEGKVSSLEMVAPDGEKRFLKGGRVAGGVPHLGNGRFWAWVEGYATGLSVWMALARLYKRDVRVTVCFSAGNLRKAARQAGRGVVAADHDHSGEGLSAARATGLPLWMPDEPGDANDCHQKHGLEALAFELMGLEPNRYKAA